jgi:predicted Holliday junction resolvase-like endonuclease
MNSYLSYLIIGLLSVILILLTVGLVQQLKSRQQSTESEISPTIDLEPLRQVLYNLPSQQQLQELLNVLPNQVLKSIQGNLNTLKGTVAEHISFLQLKATYDRLIPFNSISDFVGIKFPHDENDGVIHFIDIKTGKARLNRDQIMLKKLVEEKRIGFVTVKIDIENGCPAYDQGEPCE